MLSMVRYRIFWYSMVCLVWLPSSPIRGRFFLSLAATAAQSSRMSETRSDFWMSVSSILAFSSTHIFVRRLEGLEKDFNPIETYLLKNYLDSADNDYKLLFSIWRSKMTTYGGPFTEDYLHWHNPLTEGRQLQKGWSLVSTVTSVKIAIIATYRFKASPIPNPTPIPMQLKCACIAFISAVQTSTHALLALNLRTIHFSVKC